MNDSKIKEYVEAHEDALSDIHSEIEDLREKLTDLYRAVDTHRVEIKALSGLLKSLLKQVAQVESDLITGEASI